MKPIFYFDFVSPNAWFAHQVLPGIEQRTGVQFSYVPVFLGGLMKLSGNQPPFVAFAGVPLKLAYEHRQIERFIAEHGIVGFEMNPHFPINSLQLMRCTVAAEADGLLVPFVDAMFRAMWQEKRKLDDPAVLSQALRDAGLPVERLLTRAQDADVKDRLMANTQQAHSDGAFGIPSFMVGRELFFGKDRLADVEKELLATAASIR